jgi:hypothetical protein
MRLSHHIRCLSIMVGLAGCATQPPPDSPTLTQIATAAAELNGINLPPADISSIGITLSQHACAQWFSSQVMNSQATGFGTQGLSILGGVAAAAGGPAGAGAAAGASAIAALLGAAQNSFGAGASPAAIWGLVSRIQAAWLAAMPTPITTADAYALVEAFAEQCSLPAVQQAMVQAMMMVPVTASVPAPPPSPQAEIGLSTTTPQPLSRARTQYKQAQTPTSRSKTPPSFAPQDCYMTIMGCRVAIPRVVIGVH